jgi:glutathione S-transferase
VKTPDQDRKNTMLKIHGIAPYRAIRSILAADEAGLAYEVITLGFVPGFKLERPLPINPNNKIPALEDGDLVLFESLAINLHIAGKVGAPLMPSGNDASRVLQWTLWAATEIEPHVMRWAYNAFLRPPADRIPTEAALGKEATDQRLAVLESELAARDYLVGNGFTIADLNLTSVLYGSFVNGYDFANFPKAKAWLSRCLERPAAKRARAQREG